MKPSEGKVEEVENEIPAEYFIKRYVPGLAEVAMGVRFPYLVTVYNVSGDDTSGIAGLLYPSGEFVPAPAPPPTQRYWDFDQTDHYITRNGRVQGWSWYRAEVTWAGSVAGSVDPLGVDGDEDGPINVRDWDGSLGMEWISTGELWRSIERGERMGATGRQVGRIHGLQTEGAGDGRS